VVAAVKSFHKTFFFVFVVFFLFPRWPLNRGMRVLRAILNFTPGPQG
jgi:Zn-dependent protease